jgi:RNA polymerase sigma factor FliA
LVMTEFQPTKMHVDRRGRTIPVAVPRRGETRCIAAQVSMAASVNAEPPVAGVGDLWSQYNDTRDQDLRNRLVLQYAPLVKYVVGRIRSGMPTHVDPADLTSEGLIGLIDAIEKFEPDRGLQFQTYAIPRIRGAILDGLRAADWVPRSVRTKIQQIEHAQTTLETRLGRSAEDAEIAQEMEISLPALHKLYAQVFYTNLTSVDQADGVEFLTPTAALDPAVEAAENREVLMRAVDGLPERDQIIVALYYFENLTLAEIGQVLDVSESRVSQLHARTRLRLRSRLQGGVI